MYYEQDASGEKVSGKSYEDILARDDVDAVDLVITIDAMPEFVEKALSKGKHVISEKPMAPTVEIGRNLLHRYRTIHQKTYPGLIWSVAEQLWYEPAWKQIQDCRERYWPESAQGTLKHDTTLAEPPSPLLDIGIPLVSSLTRISAMNATNKYYVTKWRANPQYQGGYLLDGGVHEICKLRMMFGEVEEVGAIVHQFKPDIPPADSLAAHLRFQSGLLCNFTYTFTAITPEIALATVPHDVMITGTQGSLHAKNGEIVIHASSEHNAGVQNTVITIENEAGQLSIRREFESFATAALGLDTTDVLPYYTPEQALQDVAVVESLLEASRTGTRVKVPQIHK